MMKDLLQARVLRTLLLGHAVSLPGEQHKPFFIIGSGRSGTTLTRAILQAHPDLHIPPETYVLGAVIKDYRRYRRLSWSVLVRIVLSRFDYLKPEHSLGVSFGDLYLTLLEIPAARRSLALLLHSVYMHHARHFKPSAIRWGDKTPANTSKLARIRSVFPDALFVHLIRDGRDVVSSYLEMGRYASIEQAADRWQRSVNFARRFGRRWPKQYLEIRYEQLVQKPEDHIRQLCEFLDIDFRVNMLSHHEHPTGLDDIDQRKHLQNVRQPITAGSVGNWRRHLSSGDADRLESLLQPLLGELGYE